MNDLGVVRPTRPRPHSTAGLAADEWRIPDLARTIGMSRVTLYSWVTRGWVTAHQQPDPPHRWIVHADAGEVDRLRRLHQLPLGAHTRRPWLTNQQPPAPEGEPGDDHPPQL